MTTAQDTERAKFEAWYGQERHQLGPRYKDSPIFYQKDGVYQSSGEIREAWESWQAARALPREAEQEAVARLFHAAGARTQVEPGNTAMNYIPHSGEWLCMRFNDWPAASEFHQALREWEVHTRPAVKPDNLGAQAGALPAGEGFRVSVGPMHASNGVTYVVRLDSPHRPVDAAPWDSGRITPINRNDVEEANSEGQRWADFLGAPFTPCVAEEGRLPNTVPEYGEVFKVATPPAAPVEAWRPIESAPLDKSRIFLGRFVGDYSKVGAGFYMPLDGWQGWYSNGDYSPPTHWMPLPAAPLCSGALSRIEAVLAGEQKS